MDGQGARPVLMTRVGKYGRCDYKRFDNIGSTLMRAGGGRIGKVEIDCRFLLTKSQWGVIGESRKPAGIIYLDLDFYQPADCRLESATITVILAEDDGEESRMQRRFHCPVQFTDDYGPKCMVGEESLVQTKEVKQRTPEMQFMGYGGGGLGINKEKIVQTRGRWNFSGHISSTKGSLWYNKLRWELQENSLEWQPTHSNLFHTAFALEHNATKFYMTVHVSGKLAKLSDQMKKQMKGWMKFGDNPSKHQEITTKIEWAESYSSPLRLDGIARGLHEKMRDANRAEVPEELPSARAASCYPAVPSQAQTPIMAQEPRPYLQNAQQQQSLRRRLELRAQAGVGRESSTAENPVQQHPPTVALEDLMTAAGFILQRATLSTTRPTRAEAGHVSEPPSSVTLVDSTVATEVGRQEPNPPVRSTSEPPSPVTPVRSAVVGEAEEEQGNGPVNDATVKATEEEGTGEEGNELVHHTSVSDSGKETFPEKRQGDRDWLGAGVTAVLLHWFGRCLLFLSLVGKVGVPLRPKSRTAGTGTGVESVRANRSKAAVLDDAWETRRVTLPPTRPANLRRTRLRGLRGRRGQRAYAYVNVNVEKGKTLF
ncbi:uncharacterized protein B0T15DRAFT_520726 [Chaetomium strumarium]|uniref:Uncharacterized protein n=1 Tax=Chaetomium strumarium TaxID=1170767 RepID=A0AAJ0H3M0_9PEZI|nr:hypothetical protein B0T15DRAFT_520726 [Chaetomium strumarium]